MQYTHVRSKKSNTQGKSPNVIKVIYRLCYFCLVLLCFRARLFDDALWSPAGK